MVGFPSLPFGPKACRRHHKPDAISAHKRQHLRITEAGGARGLGGHSHKFGKRGLVGVEPGEEFLQSRRAHAAATRPAAKAARAVSS